MAAVHIDDYGLPYKCPFIPPHVMALEPMDETADKIRAMVGEKLDPRFMVIARPGTYVARVHPDEESGAAIGCAGARLRAGRRRRPLRDLLDDRARAAISAARSKAR